MQSLQESFTAWATLLGAVVSFVGLIQSRAWLAGIGTVAIFASVLAGLYLRRERAVIRSAEIKIEGRSIDSLNIANLRRRETKSLVVQEAHQAAIIDDGDLTLIWRYSGYCRAERETAIEFSIDSDSPIPFDQLDCFGYDLMADPDRNHKIRPILIGPDGISKKIAVPFLAPLTTHQAFEVFLRCHLPDCMKSGIDYYTSTQSFAQERVHRSTVRLVFVGHRPEWLRVYKCSSGVATLLRDLKPLVPGGTEYVDVATDVESPSARVFVFRRKMRSI